MARTGAVVGLIAFIMQLVADAYPTYSQLSYKTAMARPIPVDDPEYTIHTFNQTLDHFNFESAATGTFPQRYLVHNSSWSGPGSPIFVFTGAEGGDITSLYGFAYGIDCVHCAKACNPSQLCAQGMPSQ